MSGLVLAILALTLEGGFASPPREAKPHVWYHLMNGNVTKAGITRDFEALSAAGIGGVQMFDAGCGIGAGPLAFASNAWFDMMAHAFREAERLGLEVVVANCSGWSTAGGPWVAPSNSMKRLVHTASDAVEGHDGGLSTDRRSLCEAKSREWCAVATLPRPYEHDNGFYEDIAVLAVREPEPLPPYPGAKVVRGENELVLEFPEAVTAAGFSFKVKCKPWCWSAEGVLSTPEGDKTVTLARSGVNDADWRYRAFSRPQTARRFRFALRVPPPDTAYNPTGMTIRLTDVRLEREVKIEDLAAKTFACRLPTVPTAVEADSARTVKPQEVIDLTPQLKGDGQIAWDVPPGRWRILRFGFVSNGKRCHPASATGEGLEVDKLDAAAVARHFDAYAGKLTRLGGAFTGILVDSYEAGAQNWTQGLEREFAAKRGYDLKPYLPLFAGYVVGSVRESERVLADFRLTVSDRFARCFAGTLARKCRENGLALSLEPYGNAPCRNLDYGAEVQLPMAEFWLTDDRRYENGGNARIAASLAHVHGRRIVAAEAFTTEPGRDRGRWLDTPWRMKTAGDRAYAAGVNRLVYHRFVHQPWTDGRHLPGMTMGMFGVHFDRTQTWWKDYAPAFVAYQSRCQWLLQAGSPRTDVLSVVADGAPDEGGSTHGGAPDEFALPDGYAGDVATREAAARIGDRYPVVVPYGVPATETIARRKLEPDVLSPPETYWCHRGDESAEWYFVCRANPTSEVVRCSFRQSGRVPEIWDAETGAIRRAAVWRETGGRTEVELALRPRGSVFVVFPRQARKDLPVERRPGGMRELTSDVGTGAWTVAFPHGTVRFDGLTDWTRRPEENIRHFSGTAVYRKRVRAEGPDPGERVLLDLGEVRDFATVVVNGQAFAPLWRPPYRVDVTDALKHGDVANELEIRVTNLWPNRLIGDDALPPDRRTTSTTWRHWTKDDALLPSGLLGPVRLRCFWYNVMTNGK